MISSVNLLDVHAG